MTNFEKGFYKAAYSSPTNKSLASNTFVKTKVFGRGMPKPIASVSAKAQTMSLKPLSLSPSPVGGKRTFSGQSIGGGTGMKGGSTMLGGKPRMAPPGKPPSPF